MYRTFVILRHTFIEAIVQPIYPLLLGLGSAAILLIFACCRSSRSAKTR
jgi:hypothetical protein